MPTQRQAEPGASPRGDPIIRLGPGNLDRDEPGRATTAAADLAEILAADGSRSTRRGFLKSTASGVAAVGCGALLTACGGTSSSSSTAVAKPKYGGTLRLGLAGGTSADTLDAQAGISAMDFARIPQLYNAPTEYDSNGKVKLVLAESLEPNADASVWTMRLRPGITFHNGKELTADDVIYSFQRITNPKSPLPGAAQYATLDVKGLKKLDNLTVEMPFTSGFSPLAQVIAGYYSYIVPVGYDPKNPVGTGPFKYKSFTPGQQSVFVRNPNYFEHGLPYVDEVVITDYSDETSQVNALVAGQVDAVNQLSAGSTAQVVGQGKVVKISNGGDWTPFVMRVDQAPWQDVRVRQAMRLIVDRTQMREAVFSGHGLIGNDLFGINDPAYDTSIPQRQHDIAQAKSLLAAAGRSGMTVTLTTAPIGQGTVQAATVLAQQAKAAGVNIMLNQVTSTVLFGPNYLKWNFTQDIWVGFWYVSQAGEATIPGAPFNETHFNNSRYNALYKQILSQPDSAKQVPMIHEMQQIDYTEGGYIIPYFVPDIDGVSPKLRGIVEGSAGPPFGGWSLKNIWFA